MQNQLDQTLGAIGKDFENQIETSSRFYVEVDIGRRAGKLGFSDTAKKYRTVLAVVPLKQALNGMKVRIDGRTFVNYGQLDSGVVVPARVAKESRLPHRLYEPRGSMILNFA